MPLGYGRLFLGLVAGDDVSMSLLQTRRSYPGGMTLTRSSETRLTRRECISSTVIEGQQRVALHATSFHPMIDMLTGRPKVCSARPDYRNPTATTKMLSLRGGSSRFIVKNDFLSRSFDRILIGPRRLRLDSDIFILHSWINIIGAGV